LVPPASRLRRKYDTNGALIRSCMRGAGAGTGLLPSKAWRWNKATDTERKAHLRAAISEGQFNAPPLDVNLPHDFFMRPPNLDDGDGDNDNDDNVEDQSSELQTMWKAMPSEWHRRDTPPPGRRPWTVDELAAVPNIAAWACQWTQPNDTTTTTTTDDPTPSPHPNPVLPCPQTNGSLPAAQARWSRFLEHHLRHYAKTRNQIQRPHSVSRMSSYLNWGVVSIFRLCHDLNAARTSSPNCKITIDKFEEEIIKWREFSYAHAFANPDTYDHSSTVPPWAHRYLEGQLRRQEHEGKREISQLQLLEGGHSSSDTWNAMQQYLETTGELHNNARMTWGKTVVHWLKGHHDVADILKVMCYLNDRYALDGLSPPSYAGILWCLGWGDKPAGAGNRGGYGGGAGGGEGGISEKKASRYRCGPDGFEVAQKALSATVDAGDYNDYETLKQRRITDHILPTLPVAAQSNKRGRNSEDGAYKNDGGDGTTIKLKKRTLEGIRKKKTLTSYFSLKHPT